MNTRLHLTHALSGKFPCKYSLNVKEPAKETQRAIDTCSKSKGIVTCHCHRESIKQLFHTTMTGSLGGWSV